VGSHDARGKLCSSCGFGSKGDECARMKAAPEPKDEGPIDGADAPALAAGDRVDGRFKDGQLYPATVSTVQPDGTYVVDWDDGDGQDRTKPRAQLRLVDRAPLAVLSAGERCCGRYSDGKWYGAVVHSVGADQKYTIRWDDGDTNDTHKTRTQLSIHLARNLGPAPPPPTVPPAPPPQEPAPPPQQQPQAQRPAAAAVTSAQKKTSACVLL